MDGYWPDTKTHSDNVELAQNRQKLVNAFNAVAGQRTPKEQAFQAAFVLGEVSYEDAVSFIRFARFVLSGGCKLKPHHSS